MGVADSQRGAAFRTAGLLLVLAVLATARAGAAETPAWEQWAQDYARLERQESSRTAGLVTLARVDSERTALEDRVITALLAADADVWAAAEASGTWARKILLDHILIADEKAQSLPEDPARLARLHSWNGDGALTLPVALVLLDRKKPDAARLWLEEEHATDADRPYAVSLLLEADWARGDTVRAGSRADSLSPGNWPRWLRAEIEGARVQAMLARGDATAAEAFLSGPSVLWDDERGTWLKALRRLAWIRGETARGDSLSFVLAREYGSGPTAERILRAFVDPDGLLDTRLNDDRKRILLGVAESRGDLVRFRILEDDLRSRLSPPSVDTLALHGGRLAFKTKEYETLLARERRGLWRPAFAGNGEWGLIVARTLRNTGQADSMVRWYGRVAQKGTVEDRSTALWEWAREMEALRRFSEADTLYARFLGLAPGERRAAALLRRGICRYALKDYARARSLLASADAIGAPDEKGSARFWLYRISLAKGEKTRAKQELQKAAEGTDGYYRLRARSALRMASGPKGPALTDPEAYWRQVGRIGAEPALHQVADAGDVPAEAWSPPESIARLRDRLLLFRRFSRGEWALMNQEDLQGADALGTGAAKVRRLDDLGVPDLAARTAVKASLPREMRFPVPYPAAVANACGRLRLAPEWIWAIMRSESFFESSVVSGAGAIGLMQLMPSTAKTTGEKHGLPYEPLRSPRINLLLGVAHVSDLLKEAEGDWPVVLAGYNAGLNNAKRWRLAGEDPDFYIEMIGYRETRDYVRRVLEGFWTYREILRGDL